MNYFEKLPKLKEIFFCLPAGAFIGVSLTINAAAHAASLVVPITPVEEARNDDVLVRLRPLERITPSAALVELTTTGFPEIGFASGGNAPGTLTVTDYQARIASLSSAGGRLQVNYARGASVPSGTQLRWIQVIDTNQPLGGSTSPYLDPRPDTDNLPFYYDDVPPGLSEYDIEKFSTDSTLSFSDFSRRTFSGALTSPIQWTAKLYLTEFDRPNESILIRDGIQWG
jgi:hypothetical protein